MLRYQVASVSWNYCQQTLTLAHYLSSLFLTGQANL